MKKTRFLFFFANILTLCLEIFGKGAVCNFATPEKTITQTYSYFSLTPYGYANFGPFITAILSCVLLIFAIIFFTAKHNKLKTAAAVVSGVAVFTSLLPLIMFGVNYFNFISYCISLLMIVQFVAIMIIKKEKEADK